MEQYSAAYLGLQGFAIVDVEVVPGRLRAGERVKLVRVADGRGRHQCPQCGKWHDEEGVGVTRSTDPIWLRDCSLGDFRTFLEVYAYRVACCGSSLRERLPFEADGHRMTSRFFERVAALCTRLAVAEVAAMAQLSWDTVARVDTEATKLLLGGDEPSLDGLHFIGVDEVSRTGGRVYFTIVSDLETGRVVYIGDGKGKDGLDPFVAKLSARAKNAIRVTASDSGYLSLLQKSFPKARHILDRFHIVQAVNEALNDVRRRLFGGAPKEKAGRTLKAKQWMLLSGRENLQQRHKLLLASLMKLNRPLYRAYLLKEELRDILHHQWVYLGCLEKNLRAWCSAAARARLPEMAKVARWLHSNLDAIIAGYRLPHVDLGIVESNNLTIANLRRQARGYRNPIYFKFKIFQRTYRADNPWAAIIL